MIKYFILAIGGAIFTALLVGGTYDVTPPDQGEVPADNWWDRFVDAVVGLLTRIWGTITFIFSALTFDVPGAPWYVRAGVALIITSPIIWGIAKLIRGTGE